MNIFATYSCPIKSAQSLDDKRVNKMILENAQMFSTACVTLGVWRDRLYKPFNPKHPCNIWLVKSVANLDWLAIHTWELSDLYNHVSGKRHGSVAVASEAYHLARAVAPKGLLTPFANCTEDKLSRLSIYDKYRAFMNEKWIRRDTSPPKWTGRDVPEFYLGRLK